MHCSICKFPFPPHELYPRYGQEGAKCLECLGKERDELLTRLEATAKGAFDGMQALANDNVHLRAQLADLKPQEPRRPLPAFGMDEVTKEQFVEYLKTQNYTRDHGMTCITYHRVDPAKTIIGVQDYDGRFFIPPVKPATTNNQPQKP